MDGTAKKTSHMASIGTTSGWSQPWRPWPQSLARHPFARFACAKKSENVVRKRHQPSFARFQPVGTSCFPVETFRALHSAFPRVPVVVLTGLADQTVAVQAVDAGAQDYLVKGQVLDRHLVHAR
jgi:ActR/RegA family two-component response regulator